MDAGQRRTALALVFTAALLTLAFLLALRVGADRLPVSAVVPVPLVAAVILHARWTAVVACIALLEGMVIAALSAEVGGSGEIRSAALVGAVTGLAATALAHIRVTREQELHVARANLLANNMFRAVSEAAPDPIFAKDLAGRYLVANDAMARFLGQESGGALVGRRDRDLLMPVIAAELEEADNETIAIGGLTEYEHVLQDGSDSRTVVTHRTVLRLPSGQVVGIVGVSKDLTSRIVVQHDLERSERRFRSLVEATSTIVWSARSDGSVLQEPLRWDAYTGMEWQGGAADGRWLAAVHPDDRAALDASWSDALLAGQSFESPVRLWHAPTKSYRHCVMRALPIRGTPESNSEWVGTFIDQHDRHIAEARLVRITQTRDLVAELASRVAVAASVGEILEEAFTALRTRLPEHVALIALRSADGHEDGSAMRASSGVARIASRLEQVSFEALPRGSSVWQARPCRVWSPEEALETFPEFTGALRDVGVMGPVLVNTLRSGVDVLGSLTIAFTSSVEDSMVEMSRLALEQVAPVIAQRVADTRYQEIETAIATSFQKSMLDIVAITDPRLAVSLHYQAGVEQLEAGGDWYDVVPLSDGRVALMVGDVVGRSLDAATVMGRLRSAGRALLLATGDPAAVLDHLDKFAWTIEGARFATSCCVIVDPLAQTATYSTAGHPPAMYVALGEDPVYLWDAQGPPLAARPDAKRVSASVDLAIGGRLLLYTDGLIERRNEPLDTGLQRLAEAASCGRSGSIADECSRITAELFTGFAQQDDVAIICAQLISDRADRFLRRLPPEVDDLRAARRDFTLWLAGSDIDEVLASDIVLAASEALANAIEHSESGPGGVELEVRHEGTQLVSVVRDQGPWRERQASPGRGRGVGIIHAVTAHAEVLRDASGTTVTMTFDLSGEPTTD